MYKLKDVIFFVSKAGSKIYLILLKTGKIYELPIHFEKDFTLLAEGSCCTVVDSDILNFLKAGDCVECY